MKKLNLDMKAAREKKLLQLNELNKFCLHAYESAKLYKENTKIWHVSILCLELLSQDHLCCYSILVKVVSR